MPSVASGLSALDRLDRSARLDTHDLDLAAELCERTIVMGGGRAPADRPTAEVFHDDELLATSGLERPLGMLDCPVCGSET